MKQKLTQLFDHLVAQALHPATPADAACKYAREAAYLATQIGTMSDYDTKAHQSQQVGENIAPLETWRPRVIQPEAELRAKEDFTILATLFAALSEEQQVSALLRVQNDQQRHTLLNSVSEPVQERLKNELRKLRDIANDYTREAAHPTSQDEAQPAGGEPPTTKPNKDNAPPEVWKQHAIKLWLDTHDEHLLHALTRPSEEKRDAMIQALSAPDREKVLRKLTRLQIAVNAAAKAWLPMRPAMELLEELTQQLTEREPFWRAHNNTWVGQTWAHEDAAVVEVLRDCMKASRNLSARGVKLGIPPARKVHQGVTDIPEGTTNP